MSFTAYDIHEWLDAADLPHRLLRSDGQVWTSEGGLAQRTLTGATLDSRLVDEGILFVAVQGKAHHGAEFLSRAFDHGAAAALVENRLPLVEGGDRPVFLVEDGRAALSALAKGWLQEHRPTVIGITGSNGKTTTKDMAFAALAGSFTVGASPGNLNSSYGLPLAVLGQDDEVEALVLEMGASAPGEIASLCEVTHPRMGCVTNIAAAHLEAFGTLENVLQTKADLLRHLPKEGSAVLPADDEHFDRLRGACNAGTIVTFGRTEKADVQLQSCRQEMDGLYLRVDGVDARLPLFGEENGLNAAAACAIARTMEVSTKKSLAGIEKAEFSPHRGRILAEAGRIILDDCYNANPVSMKAALQSLASIPAEGKKVAVLGSMAELGPSSTALHREVVETAERLGIDRMIGVGRQMRYAVDSHLNEGDDLVALGRGLCDSTGVGDVVLFKGSRGEQLEIAVDAFLEQLGSGGGEG